MNFELSPEQQRFRERLRAFVDAEIRPVAHDWERDGRYPTGIVEGTNDILRMVIARQLIRAD